MPWPPSGSRTARPASISRLAFTGVAQIALVVALAMVAAVALGGGAVIVTQAAASALLRIELGHGDEPRESRACAVAAAELATEALDETGGFAGQVVVAQASPLGVDVLRATGLDREPAFGLLPSLRPGPVSYG